MHVVCDASIVLQWFHEEGEHEVDDARELLTAHRAGRLTASILDLTLFELGNVLLRALGWQARQVADQLDDLRTMCPIVRPGRDELRAAASIAESHGLTFYDAVYAAAARLQADALATADAALLASRTGERPGAILARL